MLSKGGAGGVPSSPSERLFFFVSVIDVWLTDWMSEGQYKVEKNNYLYVILFDIIQWNTAAN